MMFGFCSVTMGVEKLEKIENPSLNFKMCVQFMSSKTLQELAVEYSAEVPKVFEWKPHVFPRYLAPVLIKRKGVRQIVPMNFGLIPHFEMNAKPKMVFHNARSETVSEKASFKKAYLENRCLVPIQSFFEYIWEKDPVTEKEKSHVVRFFPKPEEPLAAAAIWSLWRHPESGVVTANFSVITRDPPEYILKTGHDRCPLFLKPESFEEWLNPDLNNPEKLDHFLRTERAEYTWDSIGVSKGV